MLGIAWVMLSDRSIVVPAAGTASQGAASTGSLTHGRVPRTARVVVSVSSPCGDVCQKPVRSPPARRPGAGRKLSPRKEREKPPLLLETSAKRHQIAQPSSRTAEGRAGTQWHFHKLISCCEASRPRLKAGATFGIFGQFRHPSAISEKASPERGGRRRPHGKFYRRLRREKKLLLPLGNALASIASISAAEAKLACAEIACRVCGSSGH